MNLKEVVIVAAERSPIGHYLGQFSELSAIDLGSQVLQSILNKNVLLKSHIQYALIGCVLPAGLGQAPARQIILNSGLSEKIPAATVNKVCGSGMFSLLQAYDMIQAGNIECVIAGGIECMSQAPYLLNHLRKGKKFGHELLIDHLQYDGLQNAYDDKFSMGEIADHFAKTHHITRQAQDDFAILSMERTRESYQKNLFATEIAPCLVKQEKFFRDEKPFLAHKQDLRLMRPAFSKSGSITAANASSLADGAAICILTTREKAEQLNLKPLAKIMAHSVCADHPTLFCQTPVQAIQLLLKKINRRVSDIDLWEINEAFAVVVLHAMQALSIPIEKINLRGGAIALGHPIGASGTRIIVSLLHRLIQQQLRFGIASICIGGGEATALAIELI